MFAGLVAASPAIVATAQAIGMRWTPSSDAGVIALRAYDVLSEHPPLLGQYSQSSRLIGETTYSVGPMLYWVLALPAHVRPVTLILTLGAISVASIMGVVALAARRGGALLMVAAAVAMALVARSLPVETPYELWNCWAGMYPFVLLLFMAWSVGCGNYRLLPPFAVTASYVLQAHLTYLLPVTAAVVVGLAGLAVRLRGGERRGVGRWAVAAVLLGLVCWSGPLVEQVQHRPGNLVRTYRLATADEPRVGADYGWHALVRAVGVRPWWTRTPPTPAQRVSDIVERPPWLGIASTLLVVAGLCVALILALRRRRQDLAVAMGLSLALCASVVLVAASIPSEFSLVALLYVLTWISPAGMFVWLTLGWSAWALLAPARRPVRWPTARPVAAGLAVAAVAAVAAANRPGDDPNRQPPAIRDHGLVSDTTAQVTEAVGDSRRVFIDVAPTGRAPGASYAGLTFRSAIAYALQREGVTVAAPPWVAREMGDSYLPDGKPYDVVVAIAEPAAPGKPAGRVVARHPQFTITLSRSGADGTPRRSRAPARPARSG